MELRRHSKAKENSSIKANKAKPKNQTPSKPNNKKTIQPITPTKEPLTLPLKDTHEPQSTPVTAKCKSKQAKHLFYRKHYYNNKEITEICDLTTGPSTYRSKATPEKYIMGDFNEIEKMDQQLVNVSPFATNTHYTKT